jgi:AcrR family transcriptional regulator
MSENRSAILQISLELFARRGYEAVGIQEIVDSAGITKPTLYHYFGSKAGLLEILLKESFAPFLTSLADAATYSGDVTNTLHEVTSFYLRFASQNPLLYRFYLSTQVAPPDSNLFQTSQFIHLRQQQIFQDLFLQASSDHGNMKGRQVAYAASLLGLINTYALLILNGEIELDDTLIYRVVHQFMHGIFS